MNDLDVMILDRTKAGKALLSKNSKITHAVSIFDASTFAGYRPNAKPAAGFYWFKGKKLACQFDDVTREDTGYVACTDEHVQALIDFGNVLRKDLEKQACNLLVHCHAGISRSTASAFTILCIVYGAGREEEAIKKVFDVRPIAYPNERLVAIADRLLGRNGVMVATVQPYLNRIKDTYQW